MADTGTVEVSDCSYTMKYPFLITSSMEYYGSTDNLAVADCTTPIKRHVRMHK